MQNLIIFTHWKVFYLLEICEWKKKSIFVTWIVINYKIWKKKKKKKFFWKSWFYSSKFWFLPPENFFDHLNSCKCKIKSVFYFHSRKLQQEVKKTALKLDAFTKIELYSLKLQFLPPLKPYFSPETVIKNFKLVNFVQLNSFTMFYVCCRHFRLLSWLQCQNSVKK